MTNIPRPLSERLPAMIKQSASTLRLHAQQIVNLQSATGALSPGTWELLSLDNGWSNIAGYIPAQVRIQQSGLALLVGHIQGGTVTSGTLIGTLASGFYNPVHAHSFPANVLAGAGSTSIAATGYSDTDGLPNGGTTGTSASASGSGSHSHGPGSYSVSNGQHYHAAAGATGNLGVAVSYNTCTFTVNTSGQVTISNCPSAASELSFSELLPLVTS